MLNPRMVIHETEDRLKPFVPPVTVTLAPGAVVKTIGADAVPDTVEIETLS